MSVRSVRKVGWSTELRGNRAAKYTGEAKRVYLPFIAVRLEWAVWSEDRQTSQGANGGHTKQQGYRSRNSPPIRRSRCFAGKENQARRSSCRGGKNRRSAKRRRDRQGFLQGNRKRANLLRSGDDRQRTHERHTHRCQWRDRRSGRRNRNGCAARKSKGGSAGKSRRRQTGEGGNSDEARKARCLRSASDTRRQEIRSPGWSRRQTA